MVSNCFRNSTVLPFKFGTIFDSDDALRQAVRVTFERERAALEPLASGETVSKDTKLTVVYRNALAREPAYLLAFAFFRWRG